MTQSIILTLLGGAVLRVSALSSLYVNYVRPGFRVPLVAAGVVVLALGVLGLVQEWRRPYAPGTARPSGPRAAWLLCLPVVIIFLIAPPALGSYAAGLDPAPRPMPAGPYAALPAGGPPAMSLGEFIGRARSGTSPSLAGRQVTLTGFAVRADGGRWYLTRMRIGCCAADASPLRVAVLGVPAPRDDTWVTVTGTWVPTPDERAPAPEMRATRLTVIAPPAEPYE
ncbi:TIGR03943 family putative permease subunit [Sphaerisporangium corydalis]|uniref:TIGR03943 family putative permease subunit n=1 Tax=Sphaerisporangium corydalis TaxID=1441875 RepID=A0ABV9EEP3_9ACTN|nr:TIGR03943 family protein [Sphaerisporangium corydalis]